jgi:hypothetical protein
VYLIQAHSFEQDNKFHTINPIQTHYNKSKKNIIKLDLNIQHGESEFLLSIIHQQAAAVGFGK